MEENEIEWRNEGRKRVKGRSIYQLSVYHVIRLIDWPVLQSIIRHFQFEDEKRRRSRSARNN